MVATSISKQIGWIDVHAHFTPPTNDAELVAKWKAMRAADFMVPEPYNWTPETTLKYMDEAGIQMQMLSNIPTELDALRASNDYAASLAQKYPSRFGFLAALPTDNAKAALEEIKRANETLKCDGFAVTMHYKSEVYLSDSTLQPVWQELNRLGATVFMHPNAYASSSLGRPAPLIEVAFETARTVTDMIYAGTFLKYTDMKFIVAHCGGSLPALSGRILALGTEAWVPNPAGLTRDDLERQMKMLFVDTAATATVHTLAPALEMCGCEHIVYGSDSGVPCSTVETLEANRKSLLGFAGLTKDQIQRIGRRALDLFPSAASRINIAEA